MTEIALVGEGPTLYPDQERLRHEVRLAVSRGARRVLVQSPCGSGKTILASSIMRGALERGNPVLFMANRRQLVKQTVERLKDEAGIAAEPLMAGYEYHHNWPVHVASVQTMVARKERIMFPRASVVVVDESHGATADGWQSIIQHYIDRGAWIIGLSATPVRKSGRGLGHIFETMVKGPTVKELVAAGRLVPLRYWVPDPPDLSGLKKSGGDYTDASIEEAYVNAKLTGEVIEHWARIGQGARTVVFTSTVKHAIHVAEMFSSSGVPAEYIEARTPDDERDGIFRRFKAKDTVVLVSVGVISEGFDERSAEVAISLRPTTSLRLWFQQIGRIMRTYPGKTEGRVIDHAGNTLRVGRIDDEVDWRLSHEDRTEAPASRAENKRRGKCPECGALMMDARCHACGYKHVPEGRKFEVVDGRLMELDETGKTKALKPTVAEKRRWYEEMVCWCEQNGRKPGMAYHAYKRKFGINPATAWRNVLPRAVSLEVRSYMKSQLIRYAKRMQKNAASG